MLVLNRTNVKEIIKKLEDIFNKNFAFKTKHCDSEKWNINRIDCGIDLRMNTDEESVLKAYIKALHSSFDSNNSRNVQYSKYKGYDDPEVQYESITIETAGYKNGNPLYRYNIYYKLLQLKKYAQEHGLALSQDEIDEIKNIIRIEKQIENVAKVFGCSNKLSSLLNEDVTEKVMNSIIKEMKLFFGTGDYLTYEEGIERIYASNYDQQTRNSMGAVYTFVADRGYAAFLDDVEQIMKSQGGTSADVSEKHKEIAQIRKKIESLGISVISVHNMASKKGISTLLDEELKMRAKPRKKHKFCEVKPVPVESGRIRYMCKPTIYSEEGEFKRTTIASRVGGTREECEICVFEKIRNNLNVRYKLFVGQPMEQNKCCKEAIYDYERFRTIVQSKVVQNKIDEMLEKITTRIKEKEVLLWDSEQ